MKLKVLFLITLLICNNNGSKEVEKDVNTLQHDLGALLQAKDFIEANQKEQKQLQEEIKKAEKEGKEYADLVNQAEEKAILLQEKIKKAEKESKEYEDLIKQAEEKKTDLQRRIDRVEETYVTQLKHIFYSYYNEEYNNKKEEKEEQESLKKDQEEYKDHIDVLDGKQKEFQHKQKLLMIKKSTYQRQQELFDDSREKYKIKKKSLNGEIQKKLLDVEAIIKNYAEVIEENLDKIIKTVDGKMIDDKVSRFYECIIKLEGKITKIKIEAKKKEQEERQEKINKAKIEEKKKEQKGLQAKINKLNDYIKNQNKVLIDEIDKIESFKKQKPFYHYEQLGLEYKDANNPDAKEIEKMYKKRALTNHPDKNITDKDAATKKFQRLGEAKDILLDKKQKREYDNEELKKQKQLKDEIEISQEKQKRFKQYQKEYYDERDLLQEKYQFQQKELEDLIDKVKYNTLKKQNDKDD